MPLNVSIPSPPSLFPIYLLPSNPFRRRRSSASTTTDASSFPSTSPTTTASPPSYLAGSDSYLRCSRCLTDLCLTSQIISKGFTGRHGRAYLVAPPSASTVRQLSLSTSPRDIGNLPNTHLMKACPRQLVTGAHTVSDIHCAQCGSNLGWKYVAAEEESQRYKVGKFILETKRVCKVVRWEGGGDDDESNGDEDPWEIVGRKEAMPPASAKALLPRGARDLREDEVEFDSQDEDECEDLFAGVWTPELARKRRRNRAVLARGGGSDDMV
jgi:hypothetical protein